MKMFIKSVAVFCAVALLLCAIPVSVFANEAATTVEAIDTTEQDESLDIENLTASDIIGEAEELREADTKHFMLTDGSMIAVSYPIAVHEQVDGEWTDIDNTLTSITDDEGDSVEKTSAQNIRFSFVNGKGNGRLMKVEDTRSDAQVIFELENAQKKNLVLTDATEEQDDVFALNNLVQKGTYTDILPDTDIEYIVTGTTLKENIIVHNADAVGAVSFVLRCKNVSATLQEDNSVQFTDTNGNAIFTSPAPYMYDAAGAYSDAVSVSLTTHQKGYLYTLTPDSAWTQSADRVYPITIDPMVTIDADPTTLHAAVWGKTTSNIRFPSSYLPIGSYNGTEVGTLLYMDIPEAISDSSRIINASVTLKTISSSSSNTATQINAYQCDAEWDVTQSVIRQTEAPSVKENILDYVILSGTSTVEQVSFDITEAANRWISTDANYGIFLQAQDPSDVFIFYSQSAGSALSPTMTYHYQDTRGIEDYWTYTAIPAGIDGTIGINNYTGNVIYQQPIVVTDENSSLELTWTYSANASAIGWYANIGMGSFTNYHISVGQEDDESLSQTYPYYLIDADGTKHAFVLKPLEEGEETTETKYIDEDNVGYVLTVNENLEEDVTYYVEDAYGQVMKFNSDGHLKSIAQEDGTNEISIATTTSSSGYLINSISDEDTTIAFFYQVISNRNRVDYIQVGSDVYDFEYDGFYLTSILYPDNQKVEMVYEDVSSTVKQLVAVSSNQNTLNTHIDYYTVLQNTDKLFARASDLQYRAGDSSVVNYHFQYDNAETTIQDGAGRSLTYQFDNHGHTTGVVNHNTHQGQFYEYGTTGGISSEELSQTNQLLMASNTMQSNVNLLSNPHMCSDDTDSWKILTNPESNSYQWVIDRGRSDNTSVLFVQVTDAATGCQLQQSVPTLEPDYYTASAYITTNGETLSNGGAFIRVHVLDESSNIKRTFTSQKIKHTATDEWKNVFVSFKLQEAETVRVCIGTEDAVGGFWVDDVCLEVGETVGYHNMLNNSSFSEIGSWNGTYTITDEKAAMMTGNPLSAASISQTIAIDASTFHELSFGAWAKASSVSTNAIDLSIDSGKVGQPTFAMKIQFFDENNVEIMDTATCLSYNDGADNWQYLCGGAEIPSNATSAKVTLQYDYNIGPAYFDDVFVYLSDFSAYEWEEDDASEADTSSDEEPYDYTQETSWYSDFFTESTNENGVTIETQTSQTITGEVATALVHGTTYYIINAATGEALYAPTVAVDAQVYLRQLDASDSGYEWTLDTGYVNQFCQTKNGVTYDMAFNDVGCVALKTHSASRMQAFTLSAATDGSFAIASGASYSEKVLDVDYDIATDDNYLTAVVHASPDADSDYQKWLFVPCGNNVYTQTQNVYDESGNMIASTDELGNTTTYTYDANGNTLTQTDPNGTTISYTYDANGNITSMFSGNAGVNYAYTNNVLTTITKDNTVSTDGGNVAYAFSTDVLERPTTVTVGNGSTAQSLATYAYNNRHLLDSLTYGNGFAQSYVYDDLDTLIGVNNNGVLSVAFVYDDNGQLAVIKDYANNRRTRLVYDAYGEVVSICVTTDADNDGGTQLLFKEYVSSDTEIGYTVSVNGGEKVSQTISTNMYGQANGVRLDGEEILTYTFDELGRLTARQLNTDTPYNATTLYYNTASDSSCTSYRMYSFSNARENFYYTYDANGNITSIGNGIVLRAFEYDALGQMTVERDRYANSTTLYTYDDGGNLLQKAVYPDFYGTNGTPAVTTYAYEDAAWADQLTGYDGTTIAYDNAGNPLNWTGGTTLTWQRGRQLASATSSDAAVTYTYNQNGIRTSKTVNGIKTTYILDENDRLTGEVTGNNTTVFLYDEGGSVYGFLYNDTPYFYLFNGQGDVVNVVDETGAVVASYNYDAWGNPISASGDMAAVNPIRYRGYYYDAETGWYYLQSRYYDPVVGRFINADDIINSLVDGNILAFNVLAYCMNNPVNFLDKSGCAREYIYQIKQAPTFIMTKIFPILTSKKHSVYSNYIGLCKTVIENGLVFRSYRFSHTVHAGKIAYSEYTIVSGTIYNLEKYLDNRIWYLNLYEKLEPFASFIGTYDGTLFVFYGVEISGATIESIYNGGQLIVSLLKNTFYTHSKLVKYVRGQYPKSIPFTGDSMITFAWSVTSYEQTRVLSTKPGLGYMQWIWGTTSGPWTYYAYK